MSDYENRSIAEELDILLSFVDGTALDPDGLKHAPPKLPKHSKYTTLRIGQICSIAGQGGLTLSLDLDLPLWTV